MPIPSKRLSRLIVGQGPLVTLSLCLAAAAPALMAADDLPSFTLEEVANHATLDDCWMAIRGNVYDFSNYIPMHPTPPQLMESWCGEEATEGMETKGYGSDHSPEAWAMMEDYLIGTLAHD